MPLTIKIAIGIILLFIATSLYVFPIVFGVLYLLIATAVSVALVGTYIVEKLDEE